MNLTASEEHLKNVNGSTQPTKKPNFMKGVYSERPKKGTGKLAWDKYEKDRGRAPHKIEYTPNYQYQYKGWICYDAPPPDGLFSNGEYGLHWVFYHSCNLNLGV